MGCRSSGVGEEGTRRDTVRPKREGLHAACPAEATGHGRCETRRLIQFQWVPATKAARLMKSGKKGLIKDMPARSWLR